MTQDYNVTTTFLSVLFQVQKTLVVLVVLLDYEGSQIFFSGVKKIPFSKSLLIFI